MKSAQNRAQALGIQAAGDPSAARHRNNPRLLRNHDGQSVVLFRNADRSAMPGAERAIGEIAICQREDARGRHNPIAPDNHRTIVERGARKKDSCQKSRRHNGIDPFSRLNVLLQTCITLQNDQSPGTFAREGFHRQDYLVDHLLGGRLPAAPSHQEGRRATEALQGAPQLRLEDHRDGD